MKIKAKPCEWKEEGTGVWIDKMHGLNITLEDNEYYAEFNEVVGESFPTLQEAQDWCQIAIDDYINEHGMIEAVH